MSTEEMTDYCGHEEIGDDYRCQLCNRQICPGCGDMWPGLNLTVSTHFALCVAAKNKLTGIVYLAGPMSGIDHNNYDVFHAAASQLRFEGHGVFSPAEIETFGEEKEWEWYMKQCIPQVCQSDLLMLLLGWEKSKGACLEASIAFDLKIPCYSYETRERIYAGP